MKFLAIEKNTGDEHNISSDDLSIEARAVWELHQQNIIREIYFNESQCAVIILECESTDKAKQVLNNLPLVKNGLISFETMALNAYSGYERLFK